MVLILDQNEVKSLITIKEVQQVVEKALEAMGKGQYNMPKSCRIRIEKSHGLIEVMPAYLETAQVVGLKWISMFPENLQRYCLPNVNYYVYVFNSENGLPLGIVNGKDVTTMRTAAEGAVGAKYLSKRDSSVVGIVGAGVQGRAQLRALSNIRKIKKVKVYDFVPQVSQKYAKEMSEEIGLQIEPVNEVKEAIEKMDIVVTCTTAEEPFVKSEWITEGTLITVIGATAHRREICSSVYRKIDKLVVDFIDQALETKQVVVPISDGFLKKEDIYGEIGEIVASKKPGRTNRSETILFQTTGLGLLDVAVTKMLYEKALKERVGTTIKI